MNLTVRDVLLTLRKRISLILATALLGAVLMGGVTFLFVRPLYTAEAKLYVYNERADENYMTSGDLAVSKSLVNTYLIIIRSSPVLEEVTERLNKTYPELTAKEIDEMLEGSAINATEAFAISVTTTDRQMSADIINTIVDVAPGEIMRVVKAACVEVIERAKVPEADECFWPIARNTALGCGIAILLACAFVLLSRAADKTVYGKKEMLENFRIPVLGMIPAWGGDSCIIQEDTEFAVMEAYRMARTNLCCLPGGACKKYAVTSAVAAEGKSTTAINLAKILAQAGKKVLLIDGDLRESKIADYLGLEQQAGLAEYLSGNTEDIPAITLSDSGIDVLVAGQASPFAAELLGSTSMDAALEQLEKSYGYILIDTPPVNAVADASVLAAKVDGYLLTVRAGFSNVNAIRQAVGTLEQADGKILGILLENAPLRKDTYGHGKRA